MRTIIFITMIVFLFIGSIQVCANEFYGYYTRLDYTIPIDEAADYIPTELTEESLLIIERMEALERAAMGVEKEVEEVGERPRRRRRNRSNDLTGRYADIVIHVAEGQQLIFSRKTAYQPVREVSCGRDRGR